MCETVLSYLTKWGLKELADVFKENEIDLEAFMLLTEDTIKELLPKVGQRLKFLKEYNCEFKNEIQPPRASSPVLFESLSETTASDSCCGEFLSEDEKDTTGHTDKSSEKSFETVVLDNEGASTSHQQPKLLPPNPPPVPLKRQNAFSFNVLEILSQHEKGQKVINNIQKTKFCTPSDRRILVALCVAYLTEKHGMKPDSVVKDAMANAIVVAFPCLRDPKGTGHGAFYTKGRKRFPAFGWLEDHLRYVRKKQKRISSWNSSKREVPPKPCENEQGILSVKGDLEDVSPEELVTMTEWLKHNLEPSATVADYMRKTAGQRMRLIREDAKSVGEILLSYPRLLDPGMIEQDFDILNPGSKNLLYQKWELLAANIIAYADQINPNWSEVLQTPKDTHTCTNDEIKNLAFFLIPILFRGRSAKKGSCTVLNSLRSFIDVKPDVTSVEQYCTDIDKKDRPQPFVLCLGSNKLMPQQSFVIIERCPIVQSSLMSAIDFCFKCHYVFDISYQPQCKGAWEFLQSEIYDLGSVVNSSISMFRSFVTNQTSG